MIFRPHTKLNLFFENIPAKNINTVRYFPTHIVTIFSLFTSVIFAQNSIHAQIT